MIFQDLARVGPRERADYITAAATKLGLSELIVEKDFWVVWLLERLFTLSPALGPFTFKGGTSLSKGFALIERFSEDIDISIDRTALGFPDDAYFYDAGGTNSLKRRVDEIRNAVTIYVTNTIIPHLTNEVARELRGVKGWEVAPADPGSIRFKYPTSQAGGIGYIKPDVLIEFGHADPWPALDVPIQPYIVTALPTVTGTIQAHILDPRRTFWEKATALHEAANRDATIAFPSRFSRHYYDVALLGNSEIGKSAMADLELLATVARFKSVFFSSTRARYDLAKPGTLRLMFPDFRRSDVELDFARMQPMLFGRIPALEQICEDIKALEQNINTE